MDPTERRIDRRAQWSITPWIALAIISAAPWAWFVVRDAGPTMNAIADFLPLAAAAADLATISWALLTRRPRFALIALSLTVFAATIVVQPRLAQPSPPPVAPFRLVSSNTFQHNPTPTAAVAALLRRQADVLVTVENSRAVAEDLTRAFPKRRTKQFADMNVFARWPVRTLEPVRTAPVAVMRVEIVRPGAPFIVYAVHLANPLRETSFSHFADMIQRVLVAARSERLPVVLAGDFNMSDRTAWYRTFDGVFRDAMRASFAHSTYDDSVWSLLQLRIDHVFISRNLCARSATTFAVPGSDHDGLEVELGACPA